MLAPLGAGAGAQQPSASAGGTVCSTVSSHWVAAPPQTMAWGRVASISVTW